MSASRGARRDFLTPKRSRCELHYTGSRVSEAGCPAIYHARWWRWWCVPCLPVPDVAHLVYEDICHSHEGRDILVPVTFPLRYLNILLVVRTQMSSDAQRKSRRGVTKDGGSRPGTAKTRLISRQSQDRVLVEVRLKALEDMYTGSPEQP